MLLIFGFAVFFRTVSHGDFHCPHCGGDRRYRRRVARRWFTLFFLPVIPLTRVGEIVECTTCRNRFGLGALRLPTVRQMEAALPVAMRAAVVPVLTAGNPDHTGARNRAVEAIRGYGAADFDDDALQADLDEPPGDAEDVIATAGAQLTTEAREWFLAQTVRVALADGALSDAERQVLRQVASRLGLTPAHAFGVIATTERAARE
ncbi:TerB family tellurite resistance protein [Actinoallomurus purpureus]|uniref:TerB family tellurite resistance protein n=1 Tax=Actinoallomurus purpureus TaxID=478114 RepID=UPI0020939843|nr:TerB family tellurite resistance protein [Actinoallomurus purpureus]MCO6006325.1 TerB family tellurite resistance protein [Actinoallomurus purpureus]